MMGNVWEWTESLLETSYLGENKVHGGSYLAGEGVALLASSHWGMANALVENIDGGFRVASVPEPATLALLAAGVAGALLHRQ